MTLRNSIVYFTLVLGCSAPAPSSDDSPEVQRILGDARYEWVSIRTPNTRIHLPAGSFARQTVICSRRRPRKDAESIPGHVNNNNRSQEASS